MAIIIADSDYKISMVNDTAIALFGYSKEELLGQSINILVPPKYQRSHTAKMDKYTTSPGSRAMGGGRDLGGVKKNGDAFPAEIGLNLIEHEGGRFVVVSIVDITVRKQVEAENLKKINALFDKTEAHS